MSQIIAVDWQKTNVMEVAAAESEVPIQTASELPKPRGIWKLEMAITRMEATLDVLETTRKQFEQQGDWKAAALCESVIKWTTEDVEKLWDAQKDLLAVLGR